MTKRNTGTWAAAKSERTVGIDVGDKWSHLCVLDEDGEVEQKTRARTSPVDLEHWFRGLTPCRVVLEVGPHSRWMSRLLEGMGHEVLVANAHRLQLISKNVAKDDDTDCELLARLGRVDPRLLSPITHASEEAQRDLAIVRARDVTVRNRTGLINHVRGVVKSFGFTLPKCSPPSFAKHVEGAIPEELRVSLGPLVELIGQLTAAIRGYDRAVEVAIKERHPAAKHLREQIHGVGPITALCFVLTIGDPSRFPKSRTVGAYLGLVPRRDSSGARDPELSITKTGSSLARRLLVQAAQYILGPFGKDSDLQRWGLELAARGGKNAKKRAVVAVARKLAVLLHSLWSKNSVYEPLRNTIARDLAA